MSVCVYIRTEKELEPVEIFDAFVSKGESIVITSDEWPCLKLGTLKKALRGIEINKADCGYEVRLCSFGSIEDGKLFLSAIETMKKITGGRAFHENDDEEEIVDADAFFGSEWPEKQQDNSFDFVRTMIKSMGEYIVMDGLFIKFSIGSEILKSFNIDLRWEINTKSKNELFDYLVTLQWFFADMKDTDSRMAIRDDNDPERHYMTMSGIVLKDGKVDEFDYISDAEVFFMSDLDTNEIIVIPFKRLQDIIPEGVFRKIDETQFHRISDLSYKQARTMMKKAERFHADNLFDKTIKPGYGFDDNHDTVLLKWDLSQFNNSACFKMFIERMRDINFPWTVENAENVKIGDRVFVLSAGNIRNGIVMSGIVTSNPYNEDENNDGKYHITFSPSVMTDMNRMPIVTCQMLQQSIPDINWDNFESGTVLSKEQGRILEDIWHAYIEKNEKHADGTRFDCLQILS